MTDSASKPESETRRTRIPRIPEPYRPDPQRVLRWGRAPELGPRILFLSGGTALRETSRSLKQYTHNSVHLVTPFDSGGSSAELRQYFSMPSIGDLRNRLLALADESGSGNAEILRLFSHRFPTEASAEDLCAQLGALADGNDPLTASLPKSLGEIVRAHLRSFQGRVDGTRSGRSRSGKGGVDGGRLDGDRRVGGDGPDRSFDLRGASVGNLLLAARYLDHDRDLDAAVLCFSKLLRVRGQVHLVSDADLHLLSILEDGSEVVGQHRFGVRPTGVRGQRIESLRLVRGFDDPAPAVARLTTESRRAIAAAELICYPMGSFYSSVIAPLLVDDVASCIEASAAPKVFVPNTGVDPEQFELSPTDAVERLLKTLGHSWEDPGPVLDFVLLDSSDSSYELPPDRDRLRRSPLEVIELPLVFRSDEPRIDPERLVEVLLSLV